MISLKGSRFFVSQDENSTSDMDYKVFVRNNDGYHEVTTSLNDSEKTELISDLIYCLSDLIKRQRGVIMIEKILEKFRAKSDEWLDIFEKSNYWDTYADGMCDAFDEAIQIVQEVAKEYGKDTNVRSKCDNCANYTDADEIDNGCYMCCKGLENNYVPKNAPYQKGEQYEQIDKVA